MPTNPNKRQLSVWASRETYDRVRALVEGEKPPFESVSEYLLTVVNRDLALREISDDYVIQRFLELLDDPRVLAAIQRKLGEPRG